MKQKGESGPRASLSKLMRYENRADRTNSTSRTSSTKGETINPRKDAGIWACREAACPHPPLCWDRRDIDESTWYTGERERVEQKSSRRKDGEDSSGLVSGIKPELELIFLARINKHWRGLQHQRPAGCVSQQNPVLSG